MKNKITLVIGLVAAMPLMNSCGVIFGGSKYQGLIIAKDRPKATIFVNDEKAGVGQVTSLYKRNRPLKIELKEEGHESVVKNFDNRLRTGNFILSVVTSWVVGIAVDLGTGAAYKPDHKGDPNIQKLSTKNFSFTVDSLTEENETK
ncbi:hypothetical protein H8S90_09585 [Olivibacter sp. SDN3]|uniref:hypothetical protein n=1 Tax=Olivibacter sp. SDN3 TaxID=2764720 RepID=UPI00165168C5|nr:hypothetical protein [Olivibacter sp. SDN3]QNL51800.1 hypothetical protein H8S90_09585 [Olivibacter sp. SDN3]